MLSTNRSLLQICCIFGLLILSLSNATDTDEEKVDLAADDVEKRFNSNPASFNSPKNNMVDWNSEFSKRFSSGNRGFGTDDSNMVNWNAEFSKRFGKGGASFQNSEDPDMVDWNSMFAKRFQNSKGSFQDPTDPNMVDWTSMFAKRFGYNSGTFNNNQGLPAKAIDWSSIYNKRGFGGNANLESGSRDSNYLDWNSRFSKRFGPAKSLGKVSSADISSDNNMVNWSSMFGKRGFAGSLMRTNLGDSTNGRGPAMQRWLQLFNRGSRSFGGSRMGAGGMGKGNGLKPLGLQKWASFVNNQQFGR